MKTTGYNILLFMLIIISYLSCEKNEYPGDIKEVETMLHCLMIEGEAPKLSLVNTLEVYPEYPFNVIYYDQRYLSEYEYPNVKVSLKRGDAVFESFEQEFISLDNDQIKQIPAGFYDFVYLTNKEINIEPGDKYELQVDILDPLTKEITNTLTAETNIPEHVSVELSQSADVPFQRYYYDEVDTALVYNISFNDNSNQDNYYYFLPYVVSFPAGLNIENINLDSLWLEYSILGYSNGDKWLLTLNDWNFEVTGLDYDVNATNNYYGILFNDKLFNGNKKEITLQISKQTVYSEMNHYLFVELFHVTKDYYDYYAAIQKQNSTQLDIYSEPVQLYTNVKNGLGIFAGASLSREIIKMESKLN